MQTPTTKQVAAWFKAQPKFTSVGQYVNAWREAEGFNAFAFPVKFAQSLIEAMGGKLVPKGVGEMPGHPDIDWNVAEEEKPKLKLVKGISIHGNAYVALVLGENAHQAYLATSDGNRIVVKSNEFFDLPVFFEDDVAKVSNDMLYLGSFLDTDGSIKKAYLDSVSDLKIVS